MDIELLLQKLQKRWNNVHHPAFIMGSAEIYFEQICATNSDIGEQICSTDIVALIGDFDALTISTLITLIDIGVTIVPLTKETRDQHEYFFDVSGVTKIVECNRVYSRTSSRRSDLIDELKSRNAAGLILFTSGTTGKPKAILHDLTKFLKRFETPRPTLKTLSFLLFDHIGGINTLLHTLFNTGTIVSIDKRDVSSVIDLCVEHEVELLPTTPTFLRLLLLSKEYSKLPKTLKLITYGTEKMDAYTLSQLCQALPSIEFRQTFGMSELGILRVKSRSRDSLYMKIGGEGVETRIKDGVLFIRSENCMLGYLNADSPFDDDGWYNTKDVVVTDGEYIKVVGRTVDEVNVGGLKFNLKELEDVAMSYPNVMFAKAFSKDNPITGQHAEIDIQPTESTSFDLTAFRLYLASKLEPYKVPRRIRISNVKINHRQKRL